VVVPMKKTSPKRPALTLAAIAIAVAGCSASLRASAEQSGWSPQRNVEFVVPTAAGSTMDLLARIIQEIWHEQHAVNVPVTIEAKSGASGALAWTYVSRKKGDGHYIAISGPTLLSNDILRLGELSYKDVTPIAQLFTEYVVFAVRAEGPIKTGANLVNAMRNSSTLTIGVAPGFGGANHVAFLKLAHTAKIDAGKLAIVPFRGANEAVTALLGEHIDAAAATMSAIEPLLASGELRAIAIAAPKRLEGEHANILTWKEQGFDVVEGNWRGIVGPKSLPPAEVAFWDSRFRDLVNAPEWAAMLKRYHWDADYANSNESKRFLDQQFEELKSTLANLNMAK
jgi:putative tricarboxylic transport membrane protein